MKALVLAGGEGTRLRPLTLDRPKPMLPIGGRPLLEQLVCLLRHHGVREIALNLHYRPEAIVEHFGDGRRFGVSITYSREETLMGTAGAAKKLQWFLTEPFFVLYGDVLTDLDLAALADAHASRRALATLVLYEPEDFSRCGVVERTPDGRVVSFVEKPAPGTVATGALANAGIYVAMPELLGHIPGGRPSDFGAEVLPRLVERGLPLYGYTAPGYILDIGSSERYAQAQLDVAAGRCRSYVDEPISGAG